MLMGVLADLRRVVLLLVAQSSMLLEFMSQVVHLMGGRSLLRRSRFFSLRINRLIQVAVLQLVLWVHHLLRTRGRRVKGRVVLLIRSMRWWVLRHLAKHPGLYAQL
jgi:hypothetical protein